MFGNKLLSIAAFVKNRPVAATRFFAGVVGDVIAQYTELAEARREAFKLNYRRMLGVGVFQGVIGAFAYLPFYRFGTGNGLKILLPKVICDDLLFVPGVEIPSFFSWISFVERENLTKRFQQEYKIAVLSGIAYNLPLTLINFAFVPAPWRVIFLDVNEVIWTAILSYVTHLGDRNKVN